VISDSEADFAGYDLGPSSPELQLGVLGSCLTHTFLIQAATLGVPLDSLELEITGIIDPRAGSPGFEDVPIHPHEIRYVVLIASSAAPAGGGGAQLPDPEFAAPAASDCGRGPADPGRGRLVSAPRLIRRRGRRARRRCRPHLASGPGAKRQTPAARRVVLSLNHIARHWGGSRSAEKEAIGHRHLPHSAQARSGHPSDR
jgi:hypothetical protein